MPIFDYQCPSCNTFEEKLVKNSEDAQQCKNCGTEMIKQLASPCFILKGKGFYSNGTFTKAKEGPKLDQDLLRLSDAELNKELGLPPDVM